jgi:hypothetical protein
MKKRFFSDREFLREKIMEALNIKSRRIHGIIVYFCRKYNIDLEEKEIQGLAKIISNEMRTLPVIVEGIGKKKRYRKTGI